MKLIQTRVHDDAAASLEQQAKDKGVSLYEYVQHILLATSRGHVRVVLEVEKGKTIFDKPVKG
jgi:hypothetical protein